MKIEFVFDLVYPMSYVAFEKLKQHWNQPTAKKIELLPVQVLPEIPEEGLNVYQYLTDKYGTKEADRKLDMAKFAAYSQDLTVDIEHMKRMPNSRLAHQAILALDNTFDQYALTQAIFHALFAHGKDIANQEVLKDIIEGMGLDGNKVLRSIQHKEISDKQAEITRYVNSFGKHPTPFYIVDGEIWDKTFDTLELKQLLLEDSRSVA
ncbi:DsbA family protein [uncultured Acinetobacter sp.]|uniref:DsbA family oxidoreductase n=1 Tax=uncultured Acinetobacter sp. TaxID=165433 RepID=UPI0025EAC4F3|nr:DsbA family protein [uncultured Acinetobacter sp.]